MQHHGASHVSEEWSLRNRLLEKREKDKKKNVRNPKYNSLVDVLVGMEYLVILRKSVGIY